ncbi:putative anaphase promoting complex subunit 10 (APC10) [Penicillium brasilianum]|uniref:Putative anaphase promoting complex subunit 10 (APC10) n=1 Tax=Penicillium brasilianum TaxID=104259 RepID=A0A1S9RQC8_PENBI|nr:putative anaphase promoting complex subunit 10 (APC10) [Penicillium brasilianum]
MPHLRRQPHPHDYRDQGPNGSGSLRTQFQTPPSRHTPSNPTHRHPPSTGPQEVTPDMAPAPAHPAQTNPFSIFRRPRGDQQPPETVEEEEEEEEEEELDDDYDPNAQDEEQIEYEDAMGAEVRFDPEESIDASGNLDGEDVDDILEDGYDEDEEEHEDGDEEMQDRDRSPSPLPPNLREISSLASWTVSTSKPGCGVAALRHHSPAQYWQSDGPQPHTLTLHFFKLVAVVRIRVYLDFDLDESYTPTKMVFLAGMGGNDLVEFATWEGDAPCGWVDVPLEGVGGRNGGWVREDMVRRKHRSKRTRQQVGRHGKDTRGEGEPDEEDDLEGEDYDVAEDPEEPYAGNVLKAMVIQMRVMENHQNGKDTHVRGFQVFACDDNRRRVAAAPSASADGRHRRHSARQSLRGAIPGLMHSRTGSQDVETSRLISTSGLDEPDWMGEPVIR